MDQRKPIYEKTAFDRFCGLCAGVTDYQTVRALLMDISKRGGILTKTGCLVIETVVGIGIAECLTDQVRNYRLKLKRILEETDE